MSLFGNHHSLSFAPADPLGDGLREDIAAEQNEKEAINLKEGVDEVALDAFWQNVVQDVEKDPQWFTFSED